MEPSKYKLLKDQPDLRESLSWKYEPDFYDPNSGQTIETKGYPLDPKARTKYRAIVSQNPDVLIKFVVQVRVNQATDELVALLAARNTALMMGKTAKPELDTKRVKDYLGKVKVSSNISGLKTVYWLCGLPVLVEVFPVKTHKKGGL